MKIALLIPSTSKQRDWKKVNESYLYKYTIKTFGITYNKEHEYKFYIGIDRGDPIYDNPSMQFQLTRFANIFKNVDIEFLYMDGVQKGHLTAMWNILFKKAYEDGHDYFFQCGDDTSFETSGWINACIETLQKSNNIGMTSPLNNNSRILTQSFVSRKHMELFGYYFPEEIINWCCDDWINEIYKKIGRFYPLQTHYCINVGGQPRYTINNDPTFYSNMVFLTPKLREKTALIVEKDFAKIIQKLNSFTR
jgi:hypothetical protein